MSRVQIVDIECVKEVESFSCHFRFGVKFQCLEDLSDPVEFRVVYVGRAREEKYDQILDRIELDNVRQGTFRFEFDSPAPEIAKIPEEDVLGVTIVMLCGYYKNAEFVRIGYYVNVFYDDQTLLDNPPSPPQIELIKRKILMDDVRVTHFAIDWDNNGNGNDKIDIIEEDSADHQYSAINQYATQLENQLTNSILRSDLVPPNRPNETPAIFGDDVDMEQDEEPCLML